MTDCRRSLLKRQAEVLEAENELQNAKAEIGLYLRNDDGSPRLVETLEPKLETQALRKAKTFELDKRRLPQITSLQTQRDLQNAASEFGRNQRLPILEVDATQFQTLPRRGEPDTTRFQLGVFLEIPLENRSGRGKEKAALAKRDSVERQLIYLEAELKARLAQAAATMTASEKRLELLNEELKSANIVANAERRRWRSGDSNLFLVAAREEEAANVEIRLWSADYDFVIAEAEAKFLTNTLF